jgi:hypothetical protein
MVVLGGLETLDGTKLLMTNVWKTVENIKATLKKGRDWNDGADEPLLANN